MYNFDLLLTLFPSLARALWNFSSTSTSFKTPDSPYQGLEKAWEVEFGVLGLEKQQQQQQKHQDYHTPGPEIDLEYDHICTKTKLLKKCINQRLFLRTLQYWILIYQILCLDLK